MSLRIYLGLSTLPLLWAWGATDSLASTWEPASPIVINTMTSTSSPTAVNSTTAIPSDPTKSADGTSDSCDAYAHYAPRDSIDSRSPVPCNTLFPQLGGFRQFLFEHGFGIQGSIGGDYAYDLMGHNEHPQAYNGQDPTYKSRTTWKLTYDLTRLGWGGDAQLIAGYSYQNGQFKQSRPNYHSMTTLAINQQFFHGQLVLQYGYYQLLNEYYGNVLGGNSASAAQGPGAILPSQVGMTQFEPVPALTVITKDHTKRWYNEATIARSGNPKGYIYGLHHDDEGFKFWVKGARPMFVDELGYKRAAGENHTKALWVRTGGIYNTSRYAYHSGGYSHNNYIVYVGYTAQLTQPQGSGAHGLYVDSKASYLPSDRNAHKGDIQLTTFYMGPFASRPYDMVSLGVSRNFFSPQHRHIVEAEGDTAEHMSTAFSISYAARVIRGINWVNSLTYQKGPTFTPKRPHAIIFASSVTLSF